MIAAKFLAGQAVRVLPSKYWTDGWAGQVMYVIEACPPSQYSSQHDYALAREQNGDTIVWITERRLASIPND